MGPVLSQHATAAHSAAHRADGCLPCLAAWNTHTPSRLDEACMTLELILLPCYITLCFRRRSGSLFWRAGRLCEDVQGRWSPGVLQRLQQQLCPAGQLEVSATGVYSLLCSLCMHAAAERLMVPVPGPPLPLRCAVLLCSSCWSKSSVPWHR